MHVWYRTAIIEHWGLSIMGVMSATPRRTCVGGAVQTIPSTMVDLWILSAQLGPINQHHPDESELS